MKNVNPKIRFDKKIISLLPPNKSYSDCVNECNSILDESIPLLSELSLPFDSRLADKSAPVCANALVASRMLKKFVSKTETTTDLRAIAIMGFVDYETYLSSAYKDFLIKSVPELWTVKRRLLSILKGYSLDFETDLDVGPGETVISSRGYTSLIAKLSDLNHWTTTSSCLEDTYRLCFYNRGLRMASIKHFKKLSNYLQLYKDFKKLHVDHPFPRYAIFCSFLDCILTVVDGARVTTVPKNNETDRTIIVDAFFPMLIQRYISRALRRCLKRAGYDLGDYTGNSQNSENQEFCDGQELHRYMISRQHYATVDFSNASNSVLLVAIEQLFPKRVVDDLKSARSESVVLPDGTQHQLVMLSSMGNGFTFEVMTTLLLGCALVFTKDCSVYGDDVIIPNDFAKPFLNLTSKIGFKANNQKTFIKSCFRESCGSFFHDDYGYMTSFDIKRAENYGDVITIHNKLFLIRRDMADVLSLELLQWLDNVLGQLFKLAPASRIGPCPIFEPKSALRLYFFSDRSFKVHKSNNGCKTRYRSVIDRLSLVIDSLQLDRSDLIVVSGHKESAQKGMRKRDRDLLSLVRLFTNRPVNETVRNNNRFSSQSLIVEQTTGRIWRVAGLRLHQMQLKSRS